MTDSVSLANAFAHGTTDKRIEVLRQIGQTGSISQAAREAGISYKAAWQAIDTLTNLTGVSLVEKVVGGVGGGGAKLTDEGERLLQIAGVLEKNVRKCWTSFRGKPSIRSMRVFPVCRSGRVCAIICHVGSRA